MPIPILILLLVLAAIALRKTSGWDWPIWSFMALGAAGVLLTGEISWRNAALAIDLNVMGYLFGVFVLARALEVSGALSDAAAQLFRNAGNGRQAVLLIMFVLGLGSAFLMNDTTAILGTVVVISLCRARPRLAKPMLLALAFSITIGSVISPIGNPQNLLIAVQGGMPSPFVSFFSALIVPTLINLVLTAGIVCLYYRLVLSEVLIPEPPGGGTNDEKNDALGSLAKIGVAVLGFLVVIRILLAAVAAPFQLGFSWIALMAAAPVLLFTKERIRLLRGIDWGTLAFFAAMFILMRSVWDTPYFQHYVANPPFQLTSTPAIFAVSTVLSQFISNVPLVTLYLPVLLNEGLAANMLVSLAVGSTIAGNLLIFGAASNIIIIQAAESRGAEAFGFFEFARLGIPVTCTNLFVYWLFI